MNIARRVRMRVSHTSRYRFAIVLRLAVHETQLQVACSEAGYEAYKTPVPPDEFGSRCYNRPLRAREVPMRISRWLHMRWVRRDHGFASSGTKKVLRVLKLNDFTKR